MSEHCVKICLKLSQEFGNDQEIETIHDFSDILEAAIEDADVGEFDGDEFGGGECVLFMYGPDADRWFEVIRKPLATFSLARGGYAINRYGPPQEGTREIRIDFS